MTAIIADIHGNFPALAAVLADIDRRGCSTVISLGDVGGYYCMINECIDALRTRTIVNLLGNHDYYLISGTACPRSTTANRCLEYQRRIITGANLDYLRQSITEFRKDGVWMVHGGWQNHLDEYLLHVSHRYFETLSGRYFFSGHTHVQAMIPLGDKIYCNPGSVGQPRDDDPRAAYAIFHNNRIELVRVEYDVDMIMKAMRDAGFSEYYYQNLLSGTKIGGATTSLQIDFALPAESQE